MKQKANSNLHYDQLLFLLEKLILNTSIPEKKDFYHLLEEVGTQPSIFYQTKVRNRA